MIGLHVQQFRSLIVRPVLQGLELHSVAAENLLVGTAVQESLLHFVQQQGEGPALGLLQMEPATHDDIWQHYLAFRPALAHKLRLLSTGQYACQARDMIGNLFYACAMARVHYLRVPTPLPAADDLPGLARYWKAHYNTHQGKGTAAEFMRRYQEARA